MTPRLPLADRRPGRPRVHNPDHAFAPWAIGRAYAQTLMVMPDWTWVMLRHLSLHRPNDGVMTWLHRSHRDGAARAALVQLFAVLEEP